MNCLENIYLTHKVAPAHLLCVPNFPNSTSTWVYDCSEGVNLKKLDQIAMPCYTHLAILQRNNALCVHNE